MKPVHMLRIVLTLSLAFLAITGSQAAPQTAYAQEEQPAVIVSPVSGLTTSEGGSTAQFTVVLTAAPLPETTVTIALASSAPSEGQAAPTSLTFDESNWDQPQTVTVTGQDDDIDDGDMLYTIVLQPAVSGDIAYDGLDPDDVTLTNLDDDTAGYIVSPTAGLQTRESGDSDTFTVRLNSSPTAPVYLALSSSAPSEGVVSPDLMTFTNANWQILQQATVTGRDDSLLDGDQAYQIQFLPTTTDVLYQSAPGPVSVVNLDDEVVVVNTAPDAYSVMQDTTLTISAPGVLSNDSTNFGSMTAELASNPTNGSVTLNEDGGFQYVPNAGYSGSDTFTYRARNGSTLSAATSVTITVNLLVTVTAMQDSYSTTEDIPLVVPPPGVLANDTTNGPSPLSAEIVSQPTNGSVSLSSNGGFTYTPETNFFGSDTFTYRARSGAVTSNDATVSVTVQEAIWIIAANDSYETRMGVLINQAAGAGVLSNDTTNANRSLLRVELASGPSHGLLALDQSGAFLYTPSPTYIGPDSFTYRVRTVNGSAVSNVATVNLTILEPLAVTGVADNYSTNENTTLTVPAPGVLSNDHSNTGLPLSVVSNTSPSHGTLSVQPNGSFTYTPATNYSGPDSFTYVARSGVTDSQPVTVSINVILVNQPPTASNDSYLTNAVTNTSMPSLSRVLQVQAPGLLANDTDPEGGPLTAALVSHPSQGGTVVVNPDGSFTYSPPPNFDGTDTFVYSITDSGGKTATATASIRVDITPPPPAIWKTPAWGSSTKIVSGSIRLEVDIAPGLTDFDRVAFYRWDPMTRTLQPLGSVTTSPYAISVDTALLNFKDNQINAYVFDRAGNYSEMRHIWLVRDIPPVAFFPIVGR